MDDESYFKVDLFCALVRELRQFDKRLLALQLAEILASRVSPVAECDRGGLSRDPVELAQRLIHDMSWRPAPPSSRPRLSSSVTRDKTVRVSKPVIVLHAEEIEAARKAIRLRFESWRAIKRGEHWHVGFARKMIEKYPCVIRQRTIEVWVREWESEMRQGTPFRIAKVDGRKGPNVGPVLR
jgi:hypothetical protein